MKEKDKKSKKKFILIAVAIILILAGSLLVYLKFFKKDNNKSEEDKTKVVYELKKYTDDELEINLTNDNNYRGHFSIDKYNDNYYFLNNGDYYILKDNKVVDIKKEASQNFGVLYSCKYYDRTNNQCSFLDDRFPKGTFYDILIYNENFVIVNKKGKYGAFDTKGNVLLEFKYDYLTTDSNNSKHLFFIQKNKVGIVDSKGNVFVEPIYDCTKAFSPVGTYHSYSGFSSVETDNGYYFFVEKDDNHYVLDNNGEVIIEGKYLYDSNIKKFYKENEVDGMLKSIDFYNIDGKFLRNVIVSEYNIELSEYQYDYYADFVFEDSGVLIYYIDKDNILVIDSNLNVKQLSNVFSLNYEEYVGYYVNSSFYVTKDSDQYSFYKLDGSKIATGIKYFYVDNEYIGAKIKNLVICKEKDDKCSIINEYGELHGNFSYKHVKRTDDIFDNILGYLISDKDMKVFSLDDSYRELKCTLELKSANISYFTKNGFFVYSDDKLEKKYLYDNDCNLVLSDKYYRNVSIRDNGVVVAEVYDEKVSDNVPNAKVIGYDIINENNEVIEYKNEDNVKLEEFVGSVDNRLFFIANNTLYYLDV